MGQKEHFQKERRKEGLEAPADDPDADALASAEFRRVLLEMEKHIVSRTAATSGAPPRSSDAPETRAAMAGPAISSPLVSYESAAFSPEKEALLLDWATGIYFGIAARAQEAPSEKFRIVERKLVMPESKPAEIKLLLRMSDSERWARGGFWMEIGFPPLAAADGFSIAGDLVWLIKIFLALAGCKESARHLIGKTVSHPESVESTIVLLEKYDAWRFEEYLFGKGDLPRPLDPSAVNAGAFVLPALRPLLEPVAAIQVGFVHAQAIPSSDIEWREEDASGTRMAPTRMGERRGSGAVLAGAHLTISVGSDAIRYARTVFGDCCCREGGGPVRSTCRSMLRATATLRDLLLSPMLLREWAPMYCIEGIRGGPSELIALLFDSDPKFRLSEDLSWRFRPA